MEGDSKSIESHSFLSAEEITLARWRERIILPALTYRKRSQERGAMVQELANQERRLPNGKMGVLSVPTIYNWIGAYEDDGLVGLVRKSRSDRNKRRVFVTRKWDNFFADLVPHEHVVHIGLELNKAVLAFKSEHDAGLKIVCNQSTEWLWHQTNALHVEAFDTLPLGHVRGALGEVTQLGLCRVSQRRAER